MKKLVTLLTVVAAVSAFSQGTVSFVNYNGSGGTINAPIWYAGLDGTPWTAAQTPAREGVASSLTGPLGTVGRVNAAGVAGHTLTVGATTYDFGGVNARAGLYGGPAGSGTFTLLVPAVGFLTGNRGVVDAGTTTSRSIAGVAPGAMATVVIRAWDAGVAGVASYEDAAALGRGVYLGQSAPLTLATGGTGTPPGPAADLVGLQAFSMSFVAVPEPSIIGLGILGAVAGLMVFRRRS